MTGMKDSTKHTIRLFALELLTYAVVVLAYYFAVLYFLDDWLAGLFHRDRRIYAVVALALIIAQGVVLEYFTRYLLDVIKPRRRD
jgi:hypothetical protein